MRSVGFQGSPSLSPEHRNRKAVCHPDRKHFAKGLCKVCYKSEYNRVHYLNRNIPKTKRQLPIFQPIGGIILAGSFCDICSVNFDPKLKLPGTSETICSLCEGDALRGANMEVDYVLIHA